MNEFESAMHDPSYWESVGDLMVAKGLKDEEELITEEIEEEEEDLLQSIDDLWFDRFLFEEELLDEAWERWEEKRSRNRKYIASKRPKNKIRDKKPVFFRAVDPRVIEAARSGVKIEGSKTTGFIDGTGITAGKTWMQKVVDEDRLFFRRQTFYGIPVENDRVLGVPMWEIWGKDRWETSPVKKERKKRLLLKKKDYRREIAEEREERFQDLLRSSYEEGATCMEILDLPYLGLFEYEGPWSFESPEPGFDIIRKIDEIKAAREMRELEMEYFDDPFLF